MPSSPSVGTVRSFNWGGKKRAEIEMLSMLLSESFTLCQQKAPDVRGGHAAVDQAHMWAEAFRMCVLEKWSRVWPAGLSTLVKAISSHVETRYRSTACLSSIVIYRSFRRSICERGCAPPKLRAKRTARRSLNCCNVCAVTNCGIKEIWCKLRQLLESFVIQNHVVKQCLCLLI